MTEFRQALGAMKAPVNTLHFPDGSGGKCDHSVWQQVIGDESESGAERTHSKTWRILDGRFTLSGSGWWHAPITVRLARTLALPVKMLTSDTVSPKPGGLVEPCLRSMG
jgi:hypothetical protein